MSPLYSPLVAYCGFLGMILYLHKACKLEESNAKRPLVSGGFMLLGSGLKLVLFAAANCCSRR